MTALKHLRELALAESKRRHPSLPEGARYIRSYSDRTANGLTRAIIDFIRFSGFQAERINCTGRAIDQTKVVEDITGGFIRIGSVKWLPTSGQKGTADISATIRGRSVKIEVKMKDRQSEAQRAYQAQVEWAGGIYLIVRSFDGFLDFYNEIIGVKAKVPEKAPAKFGE